MSIVLDGSPASEGIAVGKVFLLHWGVPTVPHRTIEESATSLEVERFHEARLGNGAAGHVAELRGGDVALHPNDDEGDTVGAEVGDLFQLGDVGVVRVRGVEPEGDAVFER